MPSPTPEFANDATFGPDGTVPLNNSVTNAKVAAGAAIDFSKLAALPSTQILVGSGANVATAVAMTGDATISNTGVVTVAGATGTFTAGGRFIGTVTASSGPGAVAVTGLVHQITTTGVGDALTLANGSAGQFLSIIYVAEAAGADTAILTPTTLAGGNTITFNALGDTAFLVYSATGGWYMLGGSAVIV